MNFTADEVLLIGGGGAVGGVLDYYLQKGMRSGYVNWKYDLLGGAIGAGIIFWFKMFGIYSTYNEAEKTKDFLYAGVAGFISALLLNLAMTYF